MSNHEALALLKDDHETVGKLLEKLTSTTERGVKTRRDLLERIRHELKTHTMLEEELVYPAFRDAAETKTLERLYYEAKEEHHAVDKVLSDLLRSDPSTAAFGGKAKVLQELVKHHVEEEEQEMFPALRKMFSKEERVELGERMLERKHDIERGRGWDSHAAAS